MSNQKSKQHKNSKKQIETDKNEKKLLILVVTGIFLILLAITLAYFGFFSMVGGLFVLRGDVLDGTLPISDGIDKIGEIPKGEIKFRINKTVTFEDRYLKGDIMFENPKTCDYNLRFTFYIQQTSEVVYISPIIKPGQYLYKDKLDKKLHKGEYDCVYIVKAYDDADVLKGETNGSVTITVDN